jgi:hypothetical protein
MTKRLLLVSTLALTAACDSSIKPEDENDPVVQDDAGSGPAEDDAGDGSGSQNGEAVEAEVDASSEELWAFFDLESGKTVAEDSTTWDLALQRFTIKVNGGASGEGGVSVAVLKDEFADVSADSAENFVSDAADGADLDMDPDYVLSSGDTAWYEYDPTVHKLTPRAHVYVVKTVEGGLFKLEITNYYNEAGSSGYPTLHFQQLTAGEDKSASERATP